MNPFATVRTVSRRRAPAACALLLRAAACSVALGALACGGEAFSGKDGAKGSNSSSSSTSNTGSGGTGTSSSSNGSSSSSNSASSASGGSGGSSSSVSSGGTGGEVTTSGGSGGTGRGGTGGGLPELCEQPIEPGDCDAYFPAFAFNAETGVCESFVYGGCGGNDNRFDTVEACLDACDPGGRTACDTSNDCVINQGCCGYCGIESVAEFEAVNHAYADYNDLQCRAIDCAYCEPPADAEQFGARCNAGSCEVYDVRQSELSQCTSDEECRLRSGLGCCEGCADGNWVAVSTNYERLSDELCGSEPVPCPACAPVEPVDLEAICGPEGHCIVSELD